MTALIMSSCSSDDNGSDVGGNTSDVIIGNWKYIGELSETGFDPSENDPCENEFILLNPNGTFRFTFDYCDFDTEIYNGQWQKLTAANMYRFSLENITEDYKVTFSENNTKMTMYEEEFEGGFYASVYQRQ